MRIRALDSSDRDDTWLDIEIPEERFRFMLFTVPLASILMTVVWESVTRHARWAIPGVPAIVVVDAILLWKISGRWWPIRRADRPDAQ